MAAKVTPIKKPAAMTAAEIDEFAMLREKLPGMKKRAEALKEKFEKCHPELAKNANATASQEGDNYVVTFGPRTNDTKVTGIEKLFAALTRKAFFAWVYRNQLTQKALDASLPEGADREDYLVTTQTGHRNIDVVRKFGGKAA